MLAPAICCLLLLLFKNNYGSYFGLTENAKHRYLPLKEVSSANIGQDSITVRISKAAGSVYFLDCINGFGGGNVAASIGHDGILLVDDMYATMYAKLDSALKTISAKPVRMVLNTHYHGDHIGGNKIFRSLSVIIGHENTGKRLIRNNKEAAPTLDMVPSVTFSDSININFNGEKVQIIHFPDSHTDGDAIVYFTGSKVLHLGDMFFFGMFPAVYSAGGGNIKQLVISLDKIIASTPSDALVVPGHGNLATMQDLKNYVGMLKETIAIVETKIKEGKSLEQMQKEKILAKYDDLGKGGAQTTDQYLAMLYKLLYTDKQ